MGKKDKKNRNDPEKKAAKQAKKEAKAEKSALKRLLKEQKRESQNNNDDGNNNNNNNDNDDDIDEICQSFRKRDKVIDTPVVETLNAFPSRRANASLTVLPSGEMILFGGECYDGVENVVFDELYRWNPKKKISTSDDDNDDNDDNNNESSAKAAPAIPLGEWKVVYPPPPIPPPRCSHQSCIYDDQLYVFGGELATSSSYHHYRDLWRFNPSTNRWTLVTTTPGSSSSSKKQQQQCPPARSGHRMISYKHYLLLFGGFYEALRETKWYDDFWVYDCRTNVWKMMEYSVLAPRPSARSGFGFGVWYGAGNGNSDVAVIYGGFCKLKVRDNTWERRVMNDAWICDLKVLDKGLMATSHKSPSWERLGRKKGEYPCPRSGMSCVVYKGRLLVYGGVKDEEDNGHKVRSEFYDDLFALDGDSRRWFKMGLKTAKTKGRRRKKKEREEDEKEEEEKNYDNNEDHFDDENSDSNNLDSAGWDLDKLRSNMFAFIDGNGNIVYEKIEPDETTNAEDTDGYKADVDDSRHDKFGKNHAAQDDSKRATKTKHDNNENEDEDDDTDNNIPPTNSSNNNNKPPTYKIIQSSEVMKVSSTTNLPEPIRRSSPLPRINAMTVVKGHTLYIYGGLLEVGDREVTLDDCWSIDLQKRETWDCIWEGTMHQQVWRGVESDEENSYVSSTGAESDDERDEDEEEDDNDVVLLLPTNDDYDDDAAAADNKNDDNNHQNASSPVESKKKKKKSKKSSSSKGKTSIKDEISRLKNQLSLDDDYRTPRTKEVLADFYSRTTDYWNQQAAVATTTNASAKDECAAAAADGPSMSQKELKRAGFALARERYEELQPVLERLNELDEMLLQPDGDGVGDGDDNDGREKKKKKDKSKKKKDKRDRG